MSSDSDTTCCSDSSEEDYELDEEFCKELHSRFPSVSVARLQSAWSEQKGCCMLTEQPMIQAFDTMYSVSPAPRRTTKKMNDDNMWLVLDCVAEMQSSTSMHWAHLRTIASLLHQD